VISPNPPSDETPNDTKAPQRITWVRRDYNSWVGAETLEDYALRFTPQGFRKWTEWRVAQTALGGASAFLILEAIGATLLVQYGFVNALWAILATGLIIFLAGLPISVYAAKYGVDMDLLTRGAGFGYIGSTITSLIYASFTFIFFALEAAVMAYALELALNIPPTWGYLLCALLVIPLVTYGVTTISRLQRWTAPLWLVMWLLPFVFVLWQEPSAFADVLHYVGEKAQGKGFDLPLFGAALTVGVALMTQMGEQADYLRFMPTLTPHNQKRWWLSVLVGGPGWVFLGVLKMLGGALLAYLAIGQAVPTDRAVDPNQMYLAAYGYVFPHVGWAIAATALFVVVSQIKINVTNAYAGSLAWSNFFSRLTHSHPGRVVWVVFNTMIAFMLMEMNVFQALSDVLGLYANLAIAWMMVVVADLVINKPLGLSPKGIEFKRAHLYDINPVGVGSMALASVLSVAAHLGLFGPMAQAFSALIAMGTAFVATPLIAYLTGGKYYLARPQNTETDHGNYQRLSLQRCVICERDYEGPDMAHCPAYQGAICSLCCTLDARCGDLCKPHASLSAQWSAALRWLLPQRSWAHLDRGLGYFLLLMLVIAPLLAAVFGLLYRQETQALRQSVFEAHMLQASISALQSGFVKAYLALILIGGLVAWWVVLAHKSRQVAQDESNRQTSLLLREIELHRQTDQALQHAKQVAEQARQAADQANQAKSRYISAISHELRTPLNSILGYAQLMGEDANIPAHRKQAVSVIKRGGEHLLSLIEGTLDIAHIESGKLTLKASPMPFVELLQDIASLFELEAQGKGLRFQYESVGKLPLLVRADEKRVRQILINLLANAIKFTAQGQVTLRVAYAREMASIEVEDTGPGLSATEIERIFEPFTRGQTSGAAAPGAGLGLTIAKMLTDLMGGAMSVDSRPGTGSVFKVKLFLPEVHLPQAGTSLSKGLQLPHRLTNAQPRLAYQGRRRCVLVVDNEAADRELLQRVLQPIGFEVRSAASGHDCLDLLAAGLQPDVILMDLAMPGIDGWETIRRLREMWRGQPDKTPAIAIVSANAFDRGLDNDVGIPSEDFILKPLRHSDLLDWLERRLQLTWQETAAEVSDDVNAVATLPIPSPAMVWPSAAQLNALRELIGLGFYRGIMNQLDDIAQQNPACQGLVEQMRELARKFQFETMLSLIKTAPHEH
jgi:signal transduction histidine kinase/CheY-like chemotaxis protein/purine-cytosine permease-like protein